MFTRIRGLLAKAEATDYAEEADAFMAKAQELMTRNCIDRTMVEANAEGDGVPRVDGAACGWRTRISKQRRSCCPTSPAQTDAGPLSIRFSVSPPSSAIQRTSTQWTCSLPPCSCRQCGGGPLSGRSTFGRRSRKPSYRRSFFVAYAGRIGSRLREANEAVTIAADNALGNCLLPVAGREEEVEAALGEMFGKLKS